MDQYFETLSDAISGVLFNAGQARALLVDPSAMVAELSQEHLGYGEIRRGDFAIELLREGRTKKFFHVVITRLDTGRYELVTYVL